MNLLLEQIYVLDTHEREFAEQIAAKLFTTIAAIARFSSCPAWVRCSFWYSSPRSMSCTASPTPATVFVGRTDLITPRVRDPSPIADTSPSRAPILCGGRRWIGSNASPPARRAGLTANASKPAPARTSPGSPPPASCSPSLTTNLRDGHIRAPGPPAGGGVSITRCTRRRWKLSWPRNHRRGRGFDCTPRVVCASRLEHPGEGITARRETWLAPTHRHHGENRPRQQNSHIVPRPQPSLRRAGPRSRPFVLAPLRALRLDRRPLTRRCPHRGREGPKQHHELS